MSESKMLIMFDSKNNNNKYYEATLDDAGNISVRYGRVGGGAQTTSYSGGKRKFDSLISSKIKKGYKEAQLEVVSSDTGLVKRGNVVDVALKQIDTQDDMSRALIQTIAKANIHNITSSTNIKYDEKDGLFKTPLGVVKKEAVEEATALLSQIEVHLPAYLNDGSMEAEISSLNDSYFVLIPNKVNTTRDKRFLLFSQKNIDVQKSVCKALLETLDLIEDLKNNTNEEEKVEVEKIFNLEISHVEDAKTIDRIVKYYNESKNSDHGGRIMGSRVKNIYKINLGNQQQPFEEAKEKYGNVHEFWHGTRVANLLSIFCKGLMMPKESPGAKAGAMFGYGIYFANQSSKSINYCDGMYWTGGSNSGKVYMFLASVAVGKAYTPPHSTQSNPPKGYDSYWAKAGKSGVRNDEIIVFDLSQVRLDYLLEIEI